MLHLKPIGEGFYISTTDTVVKYSERDGATIKIDVVYEEKKEDDTRTTLIISFDAVAEMKCVSANFFEIKYGKFNIIEDSESLERDRNSGFYVVLDSAWKKEMNHLYDPGNRLSLHHFIVCGYDSYIELLASGYKIIPRSLV
jgi:hypothetical protein